MTKPLALLLFSTIILLSCTNEEPLRETGKNWPVYGGNQAGNRYSPLDQINRDNIQDIEVAWTYRAAEENSQSKGGIQCQPIVVDGVLFGIGMELQLFALDAQTGNELWEFDPQTRGKSRGLVYWEDGDDKRILYSVGPNLYSLNAETGILIPEFGNNGIVDLHIGLSGGNPDRDMSKLGISSTSPGAIYRNTLIMGSTVSESGNAPPGHIRGFDVVTGALKWVFHTIPQPGELGYETWPKDAYKEIGGANNWSGLVVDDERGEVYLGTGSPSSDFYGGNREGANLFANCVLALDAESGELKWYYQTIHHDLWDRDLPSPPNLTTITHKGRRVDVAVQATKDGLVYVLDRDTGESIFPVEERAVPTDGLPGEVPFPTQKYPVKPLPLSRQVYTEKDISDISPETYEFIKEKYYAYKTDHKFAPPSKSGILAFGYSGGAEWGGNAIDQDGILYQNANEDPWILEMQETQTSELQVASGNSPKKLYEITCAACHGSDLKGSGASFPDISALKGQWTKKDLKDIIQKGRGRMPSFPHLSKKQREMIAAYVMNPSQNITEEVHMEENVYQGESKTNKRDQSQFGFKPRFVAKVWKRLLDQNGYPGVKPPWGTLNAIDLNTGEYLWRVPLGEYPELTKQGIPTTGTDSYGGPIVTAGGLVFIGGTRDERFRAFDKKTGKVVWEHQLPAGGFATPITYEVNGRQYVVIAAGGGRGQKTGGDYIAFALPVDKLQNN
ncbi:MAG: outer membrane protein assembly factor BamB family protein [Flagellimonas sp.]